MSDADDADAVPQGGVLASKPDGLTNGTGFRVSMVHGENGRAGFIDAERLSYRGGFVEFYDDSGLRRALNERFVAEIEPVGDVDVRVGESGGARQ